VIFDKKRIKKRMIKKGFFGIFEDEILVKKFRKKEHKKK